MTCPEAEKQARCGECRLGLGVHNPDDPLCETRVIPPAANQGGTDA